MTCYFRNLGPILERAGIQVVPKDKRALDGVIRSIVGHNNGNCAQVWKEVKKRISEDEQGFISELSSKWQLLGKTEE
jgi:hypothetical protein